MIRKKLIATAALALAGCSTTPGKLYERPVAFAIESTKTPQVLATCIAEHVPDGELRGGGDHWWVLRANNFGAFARWDVYRADAGSRGEFRRSGSLATGEGAGKTCA